METLLTARELIQTIWIENMKIPSMASMHETASKHLLTTPIIDFETGYNNFMMALKSDGAKYDSWLMFLFDFHTSYGNMEIVIKDLNELFNNISTHMPGGNAMKYRFNADNRSFVLAFLYRITVALITLPDPGKEGKK